MVILLWTSLPLMLQSHAAGTADVQTQDWVHRIRLCFLSEDPALYAKRVAVAHQSRIAAVKAMRYHLCVDSMPADDMHSLSVEQINRVLTLALNSKFLRVHHAACLSTIMAHLDGFSQTASAAHMCTHIVLQVSRLPVSSCAFKCSKCQKANAPRNNQLQGLSSIHSGVKYACCRRGCLRPIPW